MTKSYELILDMAQGLSTTERVLLAKTLLTDLPRDALSFPPEVIAEWESRADAALHDAETLIDGGDVLAACRQMVKEHAANQISP